MFLPKHVQKLSMPAGLLSAVLSEKEKLCAAYVMRSVSVPRIDVENERPQPYGKQAYSSFIHLSENRWKQRHTA
jgi:hypothetical protein